VGMLGLTAPSQWIGRDLLADRTAARLDYTSIMHVHKLAVRDGNLLFVWDEAHDKSELFELQGYAIQRLPSSDRRLELLPAYRAQAQLFDDWDTEHHLKRALAAPQQSAPTELLHDANPSRGR
jgi:hypothetical protein